MSKKIIYFVRHGETASNAKNIRQGPEGKLDDLGRAQALETARKFPKKKGRPQVIISSPYERTKETAEIIGQELGMKVEYSDLLVERKNPTEIVGKSGDDPEVKMIIDRIDKSFHDDNLRYSDEENFTDLNQRAQKLLNYIKQRPENHIIMVTHGIFLKMVIATILHHDHLNSLEYNTLSYFNPIHNAGLSICSYTTHWYWFGSGVWEMLLWDDLVEEKESFL